MGNLDGQLQFLAQATGRFRRLSIEFEVTQPMGSEEAGLHVVVVSTDLRGEDREELSTGSTIGDAVEHAARNALALVEQNAKRSAELLARARAALLGGSGSVAQIANMAPGMKHTTLAVRFRDRTVGEVDLEKLVSSGALKSPGPLRADEAMLGADGHVHWPNGAALPVDALYALVHDIAPPSSLTQALKNERTVGMRQAGEQLLSALQKQDDGSA